MLKSIWQWLWPPNDDEDALEKERRRNEALQDYIIELHEDLDEAALGNQLNMAYFTTLLGGKAFIPQDIIDLVADNVGKWRVKIDRDEAGSTVTLVTEASKED